MLREIKGKRSEDYDTISKSITFIVKIGKQWAVAMSWHHQTYRRRRSAQILGHARTGVGFKQIFQ